MKSLKQILLKKGVDIRTEYTASQDKKWMRVIDSLAILVGIFSSFVVLYFIYFLPEYSNSFPKSLKGIAWGYVILLIPIAYLLFKESTLNKIERFSILGLVLLSLMSLMLVVLVALK